MSASIAPCGINCGVCYASFREKNKCPGCWSGLSSIPYCRTCKILNCENLKGKRQKFCFVCSEFPCLRLKNLDKRYRTKYGTRVLENLERIKNVGVRNFMKEEKQKWTCPVCSHTLCMHRKGCLNCGYLWMV